MPTCRHCGAPISSELARTSPMPEAMFDDALEALIVNGQRFQLTRSVWTLLEILRARFGRFVTIDFIMDCLYGARSNQPGSNCISVFVHSLRASLRGSGFAIYHTRGRGYCLDHEHNTH